LVKLVRDSYYHEDVPHEVVLSSSSWCKSVIGLSNFWRSLVKCSLGNSTLILLWDDLWKDALICTKFLRLYSLDKDKMVLALGFLLYDDIS
jgi:hypothetical protein